MKSSWWLGDWNVTQSYGQTSYPAEPAGHGYPHWHAGLDIGMPEPTTLVAALAGTVVAKGLSGYGAQSISFRLEDHKYDVILGHLDASPGIGTRIEIGDILAYSGGADNDDGNSSGAHLHFEIRPYGGQYGSDIDPHSIIGDTTLMTMQQDVTDIKNYLKEMWGMPDPTGSSFVLTLRDIQKKVSSGGGASIPQDTQDAIKAIANHLK